MHFENAAAHWNALKAKTTDTLIYNNLIIFDTFNGLGYLLSYLDHIFIKI